MSRHVTTLPAIVLKSVPHRDADRRVTLLTPTYGRVTVIAKGARKLNSQRRSALIPGTLIKCAWTSLGETKILTEAAVRLSAGEVAYSLERLRDISSVLEVLYHSSLEEVEQVEFFEQAESLIAYVISSPDYQRRAVQQTLFSLLEEQGLVVEADGETQSVTSVFETVFGRKMRSFAFLTVQNN
jgi:DNA repair protein RecO